MRLPKAVAGKWRIFAVLGLCAAPAHAETLRLACEASAMFNAPAMTLAYEGGAEGTLTIAAEFGEMRLPAAMETRSGTDENGDSLSAVGIRAAGPASVLMPDKGAIESCVRDQLSPEFLADTDIVFMTVMSCTGEAPLGAAPIDIAASAEIALIPDGVYVGVTRTYREPTDLAVGTIALEAYPNCELEE